MMPSQLQALLRQAITDLSTQSDTPKLDAELLMAHCLEKPRSFCYSHADYSLTESQLQHWHQLIQQRMNGRPLAHLTGNKAFWSLELSVTPDVLIPRPDTEVLIEMLLNTLDTQQALTIADLGCGSGAIACALAHSAPHWQLHATDISNHALAIAKHNAERHQLPNIQFHQGSWCQALPKLAFDAIVSNPPYIDAQDPAVETAVSQYEPHQALFSKQKGLADIIAIIEQAPNFLKPNGLLLMEHGYQQANAIAQQLQQAGYQKIQHYQDLAGHQRAISAHYP